MLELDVYENPFRDKLFTHPVTLRNGMVDIPTGPGLGVEVDEEVVKQYSALVAGREGTDDRCVGPVRVSEMEEARTVNAPSHDSAGSVLSFINRVLGPVLLTAVLVVSVSVARGEEATDRAGVSAGAPRKSKLMEVQYQIVDPSFCHAATCVDYQNNGRRELLFASRQTGQLQMLNAADGSVLWSKKLAGQQQSISAYDLNGDGVFEILYSVSNPGRLYVIDCRGQVLRQWDSGDAKLGNSAVIVDTDGDGVLEGLFGTRSKYLVRLNMANFELLERRSGWVQCGCHTTAMDVDRDGKWDFFAGSGDDHLVKGSLSRFDPVSLKTVWSHYTDDNASSADAVLADIDCDGQVEIIKSVDNYAHDEAHDAIYAFETDGTMIWKVAHLSGEDSPNVADLDGDGAVEIVGMTFGGVVYCLDGKGRLKWKKDLRPELDDSAHAYMTPILGDVNGDKRLEILAMTNGGWTDKGVGIIFALSSDGRIIDRLDVGGDRYWGEAFYANIDDDPFMELVVSGSGGVDVIQTRGFGPASENYQRRRSYQRLNTLPWAYEDSYFNDRGTKEGVRTLTDNLILEKADDGYRNSGRFITPPLTLPPSGFFDRLVYEARTPPRTFLRANLLDEAGTPIRRHVASGTALRISQPLRVEFVLSTSDAAATPILDSYRLSFDR